MPAAPDGKAVKSASTSGSRSSSSAGSPATRRRDSAAHKRLTEELEKERTLRAAVAEELTKLQEELSQFKKKQRSKVAANSELEAEVAALKKDLK